MKPVEFQYTLQELHRPLFFLKRELEKSQNPFPILLLEGEMGAGKTTFVSAFVHSFDDTLLVNSPTFTLVNEYLTKEKMAIYHFDLFRLKHSSDLEELGFEEIWGKKGISLIEWWQIARDYLPPDCILLQFYIQDEETRNLRISKYM